MDNFDKQHNFQPMDNDDQIFQYNYYKLDNENCEEVERFCMNLFIIHQSKKQKYKSLSPDKNRANKTQINETCQNAKSSALHLTSQN